MRAEPVEQSRYFCDQFGKFGESIRVVWMHVRSVRSERRCHDRGFAVSERHHHCVLLCLIRHALDASPASATGLGLMIRQRRVRR